MRKNREIPTQPAEQIQAPGTAETREKEIEFKNRRRFTGAVSTIVGWIIKPLQNIFGEQVMSHVEFPPLEGTPEQRQARLEAAIAKKLAEGRRGSTIVVNPLTVLNPDEHQGAQASAQRINATITNRPLDLATKRQIGKKINNMFDPKQFESPIHPYSDFDLPIPVRVVRGEVPHLEDMPLEIQKNIHERKATDRQDKLQKARDPNNLPPFLKNRNSQG